MRRMRWLLCSLAFIGAAQQASAADLDESFLRGSSTIINTNSGVTWDGAYVGAHFGGAASGTDFSNSTKSLVAFMLRNTTIENENHVSNWTTLGKYDTAARATARSSVTRRSGTSRSSALRRITVAPSSRWRRATPCAASFRPRMATAT